MRPRRRRVGDGFGTGSCARGALVDRARRRGVERGAAARRGSCDDAAARRHPQRAGARRRRRLAGPARALRPAAARAGPGARHRAGGGRLPRLDHAGVRQPSRARAGRGGRALPRRPARHRRHRAAARHRAHAAGRSAGGAGGVLPRRVRARPARPGRRAFLGGRPGGERGAVVRSAASRRVGPRTMDRPTAVAGLPDGGGRRRGGAGRAGHRPGRSGLGAPACRDVARRRPRPPRRAVRRRRRRCAAGRRAPGEGGGAGGGRARRAAGRDGGGTRRRGGRGAPRRRGHDAPLCVRRRRPRRVADAVQRAGLRLASGRAGDRGVPAQPRRRLLARRGAPGRGACGAAAPAHPLAHAGDGCGRRAHASRRRHGGRRPTSDHQPAAGPAPAFRPGPGHGDQRAPGWPSTHRRPGRSGCGGATT